MKTQSEDAIRQRIGSLPLFSPDGLAPGARAGDPLALVVCLETHLRSVLFPSAGTGSPAA